MCPFGLPASIWCRSRLAPFARTHPLYGPHDRSGRTSGKMEPVKGVEPSETWIQSRHPSTRVPPAWCGWRDSNPHDRSHSPLKTACLPISPHPRGIRLKVDQTLGLRRLGRREEERKSRFATRLSTSAQVLIAAGIQPALRPHPVHEHVLHDFLALDGGDEENRTLLTDLAKVCRLPWYMRPHQWYRRQDSHLQVSRHCRLRTARLLFRHVGMVLPVGFEPTTFWF